MHQQLLLLSEAACARAVHWPNADVLGDVHMPYKSCICLCMRPTCLHESSQNCRLWSVHGTLVLLCAFTAGCFANLICLYPHEGYRSLPVGRLPPMTPRKVVAVEWLLSLLHTCARNAPLQERMPPHGVGP